MAGTARPTLRPDYACCFQQKSTVEQGIILFGVDW